MRTGPRTDCTSVGQIQAGHVLNYYCYIGGENDTWTYLRNQTTQRTGWSMDTFLPNNGSSVECR